MIHGIWSTTDRIFSHSGPFFALLHPLTQPPPAPVPPPRQSNNPENQNFEKMKKTTGDIIILHRSIKNYD